MKKILTIVFFTACLFSFSDEIEFTENIYGKTAVSFSDGVTMFCHMYKLQVEDDFERNLEKLKSRIRYMPKKYGPDKNFTVGDFSLFAMQYLNLRSGLFYLASHDGRYATRELMIRNIVPFNTSEYEKISGQEFVTLIQKVVEYEEKK